MADDAPVIVVVGSSNTDLVAQVPELPRAGATILGGDLLTLAGGKGANQAVAARRAGAVVYFIGCLGRDNFGDQAMANLAAEGIYLDYVYRTGDAPSGVALIAVATNGQNSIVVAPGANTRLEPGDIDRAAPVFARADLVVAQLEVPIAAVRHALTYARERGVSTLLNAAPAQPLDAELLGVVDVLVCNETEAEALTGLPVADAVQAEAAARALGARGPRLVILTRGAEGALLAEGTTIQHVPAFRVQAVDTTAAGDAFIGSLACELARGHTPQEAAHYASAAAALSVQRMGAQASLPTATAVLEFLAERERLDSSGAQAGA
ncbi:MAG: ribokinase [Ktedonobacterales bacterium]